MAAAVAGGVSSSSTDPWTNYELILYYVHGARSEIQGERPRVPPNTIVIASDAGMSSGCAISTKFDDEVFELFNSTNLENTIRQLKHGHVPTGSLLSLYSYRTAGEELPAKTYDLDGYVGGLGIYYWSHTANKFVPFHKFAKWLANKDSVSETELLEKAPKTEGKTTIHVINSCDIVPKFNFDFFHTNINLIGNNKIITRGATRRAELYISKNLRGTQFSQAQLRTLRSARNFVNVLLSKIINENRLNGNITTKQQENLAIDAMKSLLAPTLKKITENMLKDKKNPRIRFHNRIRNEIESFYDEGKFGSILDSITGNAVAITGGGSASASRSHQPVAITGGGSASSNNLLLFPPNTPPSPPTPPTLPSRRYKAEWHPNFEEYGILNKKTGNYLWTQNLNDDFYEDAKNNSDYYSENEKDHNENEREDTNNEEEESILSPPTKFQRTGNSYSNRMGSQIQQNNTGVENNSSNGSSSNGPGLTGGVPVASLSARGYGLGKPPISELRRLIAESSGGPGSTGGGSAAATPVSGSKRPRPGTRRNRKLRRRRTYKK